jgi:DNA-binding MarR family transcriptional regulator
MGEAHSCPPTIHTALLGNTAFLLSRLGSLAAKQFTERLQELGLTPRMWGALNVLDADGAITQHSLCKSIGTDPSSMVSTIDELEAKGLVERRRHPSDRRAHALHVTAAGRETLADGRRLAGAAQDELLAPLNPGERAQLQELLLRLAFAGGSPTAHGEPSAPTPATQPA